MAFIERPEALPFGCQPVLTRAQEEMLAEFGSGYCALDGNKIRFRFYPNDHLPGREYKPCRSAQHDQQQCQRAADDPSGAGGGLRSALTATGPKGNRFNRHR